MKLPHALKKGDLINVLITSVIVFLTYYLCLKFVFPGYFEPLTPQNIDYYIIYSGSPQINFLDLYKAERPIGALLINLVSLLGLKLGIVFSIALTLINIVLTVLSIRIITGKFSYLLTAIYTINIFTNPYFYFSYSYDIANTIAYFFFILIVNFWYKYKNDFNIQKILFTSLLIFMCFFTKESYFIALVLFFIFQFVFENKLRKYSSSFIIISSVFILLSVFHSHLVNSTRVNFTNASTSPYFVSLDPKDIILTYLYYIQGIVNIYAVLLITLSLTILMFAKKYIKEAIMLMALGLSAYIPYSLQPNHKAIYYFSIGIPLIYAVILFLNIDVLSEFKAKIFNKFRFNKKHAFSVVALLAITLTFFKIVNIDNDYPSYNYWWYLQQESLQKNILNSFETVKQELSSQDDKNVLILGLKTPWHPFKGAQFIDNYFDNKHTNWTIALYDDPWVKANTELSSGNVIIKYVNISEINPNDYTIVITYNQKGEMEQIIYPKSN